VEIRTELVKQETQLLMTNRTTHLCKCNGVAELLPCRILSFWVKQCTDK